MKYKERSAATRSQEYIEYLIQSKKNNGEIPSQREIAEHLSISRNAVLHALNRLKSEDQVVVKERTGIISNTKIDINMLGMNSMTNELKDNSVKIKHLSSKVISVSPSLEVFFEKKVEKVIKVIRVRLRNDIPLTYEIAYFNQQQFVNLENVDFTNKSLYKFLKAKYRVSPFYGRETVSCQLADEKIGRILQVPELTPLYRVESFNYQEDDTPLETTEQYLIASMFKYHFSANNIYDYRED